MRPDGVDEPPGAPHNSQRSKARGMTEAGRVKRRRQFCARCGQLMFECYCSLDGHFGMVDDLRSRGEMVNQEFLCPTCGARYRWLDRLGPQGQPVVRA